MLDYVAAAIALWLALDLFVILLLLPAPSRDVVPPRRSMGPSHADSSPST
jgi:hypothetical protein